MLDPEHRERLLRDRIEEVSRLTVELRAAQAEALALRQELLLQRDEDRELKNRNLMLEAANRSLERKVRG